MSKVLLFTRNGLFWVPRLGDQNFLSPSCGPQPPLPESFSCRGLRVYSRNFTVGILIKTQEEDDGPPEGSTSGSAGSAIENLLEDEKFFEQDDIDTPRITRRRGGTVDPEEDDADSSDLSENEGPIGQSELETQMSEAYKMLALDEESDAEM